MKPPTTHSDHAPTTRRGLLTTPEVADALGVPVPSVCRLIRRGDLPAKRLGRSWRVRPADLDRFVESLPGNGLAIELTRRSA